MASINIHSDVENSQIINFYQNKNIFITGGTGFLGKALIEKLLRTCYDLKKIYVLIRNKKGVAPNQRLSDFCNIKLFDSVRKNHPDFLSKLEAINGDLCEPNLGMSVDDQQKMIDNINIVFHSAATVKFDEPLKVAVEMNIIGTQKVVNLVKKLKYLEAFVHVSTAYSNCDRKDIDEVVYNPPVQPERIIEAVEWLEDDLLNLITPNILKMRPNTYTFTKAIAESLVVKECENLPCTIVRPSIITATWREPFPGWIDNFNGPTGLLSAFGTGLLHSMLAIHDAIADIIPVDIPVNLMIAAAWHISLRSSKEIVVYNCTSGQINKFTWGNLEEYGRDVFIEKPFENMMFVPNPHLTHSKNIKFFRNLFEQLIPAYVMDFFLILTHKKPKLVKLQHKMKKTVQMLEYFTTKTWEFTNDNLNNLMKTMNQTDIRIFNFDIKDLNWKSYIENYIIGTKIYLMKEDLSKTDKTRLKIIKMKRTQNLILCSIIIILMISLFRFLF